MTEKIRRLKEEDFLAVSELFNHSKSIEELKWLFTNPNNHDQFNAFVTLKDDEKIIGVIGCILSDYRHDEINVQGVAPMSWRISSDYKGFAGIKLLKKALEQGDFGIAIGGTKIARELYSLFKFSNLMRRYKLFKIYSLRKFFSSLDDPFFIKIIKICVLLPGYINRINNKTVYKNVELIEYDKNNFVDEMYVGKVFQKVITKNYIDWLLRFPNAKTYGFIIKLGDNPLGMCIFYIREIGKVRRGRIVYSPFLGNDMKLWRSVIYKSLDFFKSKNCAFVTAVATNKTSLSGFSTGMFKFMKSQPILIKDTKHILKTVDINNWYMQYAEGDRFYMDL